MADINALLDGFASRLDVVEKSLGIVGGGGGGASAAAVPASGASEDSPAVKAFDEYSNPELENFAKACAAIGGDDAATCNTLLSSAWAAQRAFLVTASQCKKPADLMAVMKGCGVVDACQAAGKAQKRGDFELHYKAVAEGLGCLNWLMIEPKPRDFIEAQIGSMDYSANKIRMQFKRNTDAFNADQHLFCDSLKKLLAGLIPYTKAHHLTGVTWNPRGGDAASGMTKAAAAAPAAAAPAAKPAAAPAAKPAMPAIGDLKAEMEAKKDNAAAGLKKVTKDMQTWREDYKGGDAPKPVKPKVAPRPVVIKTKGTKQVEFKQQGRRWCIEAQTKDDGVVEVKCDDVKHSIAIYGCFQATINIVGKCKGVTIDSCEQTQVLLDTAISAVELVNCKRMKVQIRETAPTVAIDKTDGCQVFLSAAGLETGFTTAKSSEMNVSFPDPKSADGELIECPIPEQFVHKVMLSEGKDPHMSAEVSDLYSH